MHVACRAFDMAWHNFDGKTCALRVSELPLSCICFTCDLEHVLPWHLFCSCMLSSWSRFPHRKEVALRHCVPYWHWSHCRRCTLSDSHSLTKNGSFHNRLLSGSSTINGTLCDMKVVISRYTFVMSSFALFKSHRPLSLSSQGTPLGKL